MPVYPGALEFLGLSITVVQLLFTTLTSLFHKKCNRLKARVVIYAYNHHVRLLSPGPMVVKQPKFTRVEEPTLLCNHFKSTWTVTAFYERESQGENFPADWKEQRSSPCSPAHVMLGGSGFFFLAGSSG